MLVLLAWSPIFPVFAIFAILKVLPKVARNVFVADSQNCELEWELKDKHHEEKHENVQLVEHDPEHRDDWRELVEDPDEWERLDNCDIQDQNQNYHVDKVVLRIIVLQDDIHEVA